MSEHRLGQIVIERPRNGRRISQKKVTGYKKFLNQITLEASEDGLFSHYLIKNKWRTKYFSDNLSPLERWLKSKVGQPWDSTYSELCQKVETKTLAGQHLISHLWQMVERHVIFIDGLPYSRQNLYHAYPLGKWKDALYVHPETGILCLAKKLPRANKKKPDDLVVIDKYKEYRKINELWYLLTFDIPYGAINKKLHSEIRNIDGRIYIARRRQCNKKEIKLILQQIK
ncbi:hypothetical protein RIVM261_025040 [Rivularia sp. IAM M-261]|nr:hypothetical protein CAL7716_021550 [Calothrix sp. PCC 7716]GJD17548.1 hypothetical protein RIVM261_025040 [Rivularia sp. IAM M-261]